MGKSIAHRSLSDPVKQRERFFKEESQIIETILGKSEEESQSRDHDLGAKRRGLGRFPAALS